jgi:hypothetical protein
MAVTATAPVRPVGYDRQTGRITGTVPKNRKMFTSPAEAEGAGYQLGGLLMKVSLDLPRGTTSNSNDLLRRPE